MFSLSEVWLVLRFGRSALWPTSRPALELSFHCVCLFGGLFFCLAPFLWGKVRDLSAGSLLSVCYDGWLIIFRFCNVIWFWMLLTGSADELCGLLPALFQAAAYHPLTVSPSVFPVFVYWKFAWRSAPCPSPLLQCAQSTPPPLLSFPFYFLVYYSVFCLFVLRGRGQSVQGALLIYPRGGCGITVCHLFAHLLVCWMSPKQVWSWRLAARETSCFLSVMCCGKALYGLWFQIVDVFILLGVFFLPSVAQVSQEVFWFTELMLSPSAL
jgi:hypothetical protein